ncbi:glucosylceramidase [Krasilnikovia cinnamomea]|uniref:Glucosylceramidase n=1 Tax=Krasilnikovia cinnamomea TaxID=349313 RepID=A0A4Q7ZKP4_9ACTN|nr:ricin-type beta-trefoil lectin domain protein [Krasilnikovia cinnamomea]RZU51134.1 glucosylceramidase [Krasilnikovia cinnamomea]
MSPRSRRLLVATVLAASATILSTPPALAANEQVHVYLTTTSDSAGRTVTRGLQPQPSITFTSGGGAANQTITVNENATYQQFEGAGASITDTAAFDIRGSGALSPATQNEVMTKLFDPAAGIGVSALRNVIGSSDLAQNSYSYDTTCCDLNDFSLSRDADIMALTKQARALNPALFVMASPWSAPPWMKDNNAYSQGWLRAEYYGIYAQYFVKYIQGYQGQGIPIRYVTEQNEPGCCPGYPSMQWNTSGLGYFAKTNLLPALQNAGLDTKLLIGDWNFDTYDAWVAPLINDSAIRTHPNFGGIAWHDYGGNPATASTVHGLFPGVNQYNTEHSGGTWVSDQHAEDMGDLVDYFRHWGRSWTKWSLAVDEAMGPHNGGCGTCTGLVTVHRNDARRGQVDYTIEYYTMGHLTKFVRPGAVRIDSTANGAVPNVAFRNPDGSKALIAYNTTGGAQTVKVNWGGQSFTYALPARTSATFTWTGAQSGGGSGRTGQVVGLGGKCVDVAGANPANGTPVQLYDCNGTPAQSWTLAAGDTVQALGKCLDVTGGATTNGTKIQLYDCNGTNAQKWTASNGALVNTGSGTCLDATDVSSANGTRLQIWACTGAPNQHWQLPA